MNGKRTHLAWDGHEYYARRSLLDGQLGAHTPLGSASATVGRHPGDGEPCFTSPPTNKALNARQILVTRNSNRDVLEWKHTHTWNWMELKESGDSVQRGDELWWRFCGEAGIPQPIIAGTHLLSPVPLTDTACFSLYSGNAIEYDDGLCIYPFRIYSDPGQIGPEISWSINDMYDQHQFIVRRKCRRYIYYENCEVNNDGFVLGRIRHIIREIDPRRVEEPLWDQGGTQPPAPDPKYLRNYNDVRFIPYGITDASKYWVSESMQDGIGPPNPTQPDTLLSTYFKHPWYEQDAVGVRPPLFYDEYSARDGFSSSDVGEISASKVFGGMFYMAQPWARQFAVNDGHTRIVPDRAFDMLIAADFYKYMLSEITGKAEYEDFDRAWTKSGFAGAYGTCYAIF